MKKYIFKKVVFVVMLSFAVSGITAKDDVPKSFVLELSSGASVGALLSLIMSYAPIKAPELAEPYKTIVEKLLAGYELDGIYAVANNCAHQYGKDVSGGLKYVFPTFMFIDCVKRAKAIFSRENLSSINKKVIAYVVTLGAVKAKLNEMCKGYVVTGWNHCFKDEKAMLKVEDKKKLIPTAVGKETGNIVKEIASATVITPVINFLSVILTTYLFGKDVKIDEKGTTEEDVQKMSENCAKIYLGLTK